MRSSLVLAGSVAAAVVAACGSSAGSGFTDGSSSSSSGTSGTEVYNPIPIGSSGGGDGGTSGAIEGDDSLDIDQASLRIEPPDAVLTVKGGQQVTQPYKVFGKVKSAPSTETDLTARFVFYVPDNFLVGGFPTDGGPLFTSRLPKSASEPAQRAGKLTVQARARNSGGEVKVTTSLTVKLEAALSSPNTFPSLPAKPEDKFKAAPTDAYKPELVYPNDGVMLPPNVRRLEVHWRPGNPANTLYEIRFTGAYADIVYYSRCSSEELKPANERLYVDGACAFELDEVGYGYVAESNRGNGPVKLRIRATDDGTNVGASAEFDVEFAESRVDGGLYYWQTTGTVGIYRFDFGAPSGNPEQFLVQEYPAPSNNAPPNNGTDKPEEALNDCVGCHALSRDGKKIVASLGGQEDGRLVFMNDLSRGKSDPNRFTVNPNAADGAGKKNRIQFASFSPDGSQFVAVYGDVANANKNVEPYIAPDDLDRNKLWFHDGETGLRSFSKTLPFRPDHPDWSPDGNFIAVTHVGDAVVTTSQRPQDGSIEIMQKDATAPGGFGSPINIVPALAGHNRFNPNFVPDSSFLYYTEADCLGPPDSTPSPCDGDADWTASTWVTRPLGGTPIHLANAAKPGVADGANTNMGDTFPRSAPFKTAHRGGQLFWFTVASRRNYGLRKVGGAQHLWMFAIDPAKVLAGQDGSFPGFYLPFQDNNQSNHIGQWTERVVNSSQPPPEPPPTAPPVPEPPPPVIK